MDKSFFGNLLLFSISLTAVLGQGQTGFISIDCGASKDYTDTQTGIVYSTDAPYIKTGQNYEVQPEYKASETQLVNVRSFPNGTRNCYTLVPLQGNNVTKYLIRARFMYGNYDSNKVFPEFDLYLGVNLWSTINITSASTVVSKELVQVISSNVTYICLVNTGLGTPFISAIELRPLISTAYETKFNTIALHKRVDFGNEEKPIRFPDDTYDRIWETNKWSAWMTLSTSGTFDSGLPSTWLSTPSIVMGTAVTPINSSEPFGFYWKALDLSTKYFYFIHFGEVEKLQPNQTRKINIKLNGVERISNISLTYLYSTILHNLQPAIQEWYNFTFERTADSTLPPIVNALEVFFVKDFLQSETDQADVSAMKKIQTAYSVVKDWVADPCAPQNHSWDGVDCIYNNYDPPRIISLNLSSSGLTGKISDYISDLKLLQHLDLSNNNLTGSVPDFLSQMTSLTVLNLSGNNLTGTVPAGLTLKTQQGSLLLSVEGNPNLCSSGSCTTTTTSARKKRNVLVPIIISVVVAVILLVTVTIVIFRRAKLKNGKGGMENAAHPESSKTDNLEPQVNHAIDHNVHLKGRKQRYSFSDILIMTNNFERLIGEGGGGKVYHGTLEDKSEVAVKVLKHSDSSEGYREFQTEAEILMMVHHTNLVSMIGYCQEGKHLIIVYELMANGNLENYLSPVVNPKFPSWEERLNMALDAAQGLQYLHHGLDPAIVHRDIKSTNILLNKALQAKLADFGISKLLPDGKLTHPTTRVMGTRGYIDPELIMNHAKLSEKSDVYGFGVVLCEILTGQHAVINIGEGVQDGITNWVSNIIAQKGDVRAIMDPRLQDNFDVNSAWKLVETATACVSIPSSRRPTMNKVVLDIKQCLDMEKARKRRAGSRSSDEATFLDVTTTGPAPR